MIRDYTYTNAIGDAWRAEMYREQLEDQARLHRGLAVGLLFGVLSWGVIVLLFSWC